MRSHAKASSVGPNSDRGGSRRSFSLSGAGAAVLLALLAACFLPASASAIEFRSLTDSFGPDGTSGTTFSEYLGPLAFDQGSKHLYALDSQAQEISGFNAPTPGTHTPLGGVFPLSAPGASELDDIAVDSSSHNIYFTSKGGKKVYGFDEGGNTLSGFPITAAGSGNNFESPCGVAVDPSGQLWIADRIGGLVYQFSGDGDFTPYNIGHGRCRMALDSDENLFIANAFGAVSKYTAASQYVASSVIDPGFSYGIAVDRSTDELYVVHSSSISVYDSDGTFLYEFGGSVPGAEYYGELGGIAIDEASEEVYVSDYGNHRVDVFGPPLSLPKLTTEAASGVTSAEATVNGTINPRGIAVEECHFEVITAAQFIESKYENVSAGEKYPCVPAADTIPVDASPHAVSASVTGLNPATIYHYRLVASNSIGEARGGDRQLTTAPTAPLVEEQSVEAVGTNEATVAAKINPRGGETTYHVEYGTSVAYGQSSAESAPFGFSSDNSKHPVSVHIAGLQPGTAYHFRFVATNGVASAEAADSTFATYPASAPAFATCPNDVFRTGAGSRLPDCRAYEQGTPIEKHGGNAQGSPVVAGVSASGDRFTFAAPGGLPTTGGSSRLDPFLASRGAGGWSTDGFLPPTQSGFAAAIRGVNEDLSVALVEGEGPGGVGNALYLRDSETATSQLALVAPERIEPIVDGFTADPHHLIFRSESQLLPDAPAGKTNLYDLDHGTLTLADRVPAGSAISCDDEAGPACEVPAEGISNIGKISQISRDGSRTFFTAHAQVFDDVIAGRIYMREDGVRTAWISTSQRTTPDPNGEKPATLVGVTPDGSKAFFLSCEKLTDDSTAVSNGENSCTHIEFPLGDAAQGQDLYSYDTETGELADLTVDANPADPVRAQVRSVIGISEDGSDVYFLAGGVLAPGASSSRCHVRECNLYAYHDGATTFIAQLGESSVDSNVRFGEARVSADGRTLTFAAVESLTGYDNVGPCGNETTAPCQEFFRYSAPEEELLCLTCLPTGIPPGTAPTLGKNVTGEFFNNDKATSGPSRNLSADGSRFFFQTSDALVPRDTNGVDDVYEWEAKGAGSCESESQNGGCIYLISGGTDPQGSGFLGASKDGDHAFFFTEQQLVPGDQDQLFDVYDAGVGAGIAAQHELSPPTCTSTACQSNPPPPPDQTLSSAAFRGPGNAREGAKARKCPRGKRKVRSGGKVSCKKAHKQHKRHTNRGGSK